jgi:hypothetical protein
MRKLFGLTVALGILAVFSLFHPSASHAWPITSPYGIIVDTEALTSIQISTAIFPSATPFVNNNIVNSQWCLSHLVVSSTATAQNLTISWSTGTLGPFTTDYYVVTHPAGIPYDEMWSDNHPYCAPTGKAIVQITTSGTGLSASTITVEGYMWMGVTAP